MNKTKDAASVLARLAITGIVNESVGADDADKMIKTDEFGLISLSFIPSLETHVDDTSIHLTSTQNTLLDGITVTYDKINYLSTVSSNVQTQLTAIALDLSNHASDASVHLTSTQNTLLDGITVTYDKINYLSTVSSNVQTQIDTINANKSILPIATHSSGWDISNTYLGYLNSCSAGDVNIPVVSGGSIAAGSQFLIYQSTGTTISFTSDVGVTLNSPNGYYSIASQYGIVSLIYLGSDTWVLTGNLS